LEVDGAGRTLGAITPEALTNWSMSGGVVRAFKDLDGGDMRQVLERNLAQPNSPVFSHALYINGTRGADVVCMNCSESSAPLLLAPVGSSKFRRVAGAERSPEPLVTYRTADWTELSELSRDAMKNGMTVLVPDVGVASRIVPERRVVQLEVRKSQVAALQAANPKVRITPLNGRFTLSLASNGALGPSTLNPELERVLTETLTGKKAPSKKPLLIVVDDAWPSDAEFLRLRSLIEKMYATLWRSNVDLANQNPELAPSLAPATLALTSPGIPRGANCAHLATCPTHARKIHYSILKFQELARSIVGEEPVDVLYMPLTTAQDGARDILRLLWNLLYARGPDYAPNSPTFAEADATRVRQEQEFLDSIQDRLTGSNLQTNWGVISSIAHFAWRYGLEQGVPVFLNFSWTSDDQSFYHSSLTEWNTMAIAAAGNHCQDNKCGKYLDEIAPERHFFRRTATAKDFLVVVNLDTSGTPTCHSSRIRTNIRYPVIGFDGAISGDCGTSFASPRVAWLLAARAAYTQMKVKVGTHQSEYLHWILDRPARKKCASDDDFKCVQLLVDDLMSDVPKTGGNQ
jgi:hypothetical protein